jgi:hypothetical protein
MDSQTDQRWKKVAGAAARLATIYVVGVLVLYAPIRLWLMPHAGGLQEVPRLSAEMGILAANAFVILAVARRVGFLLLWTLLLFNWVSNFDGAWELRYPGAVAGSFILWTVLALPLYAMAALGGSDRIALRVGSRRIRIAELGALAWILLIVGAFLYELLVTSPFVAGGLLGVAARFVWFPAPFILAVIAGLSIWTVPSKDPAGAA